ncbi:hypothetical protein BDP81DRAFT_504846 [Colletotrichum phormii]|uniref:Uncharacterized protein n=1 Tax=Colletotrichum phormii TaxID=359342 RepID=A0AAJ0A056_9PEZI|nr:uncharacterized protein BDP81DRAFT_504846 [Colletotrichum phormii]KAK1641442.1 hypothetical protein BDP81DRAFT_504846 [Colletotrichum phormii]
MSDYNMSESDEDGVKQIIRHLENEFERYKPGKTLTLCLRDPGIRPESNEWLLPNFNPTIDQPDHEAQVEIIEYLRGGNKGGALVLLCKIIKVPSIRHDTHHPLTRGLKVVLKVFDSAFFPQQLEIFLRDHTPSDLPNQLLSREANAYEYFYGQNMTGDPHMVPQYYGSWALKFDVSDSSGPSGSSSTQTRPWRCVGAVLIEHIRGRSLEKICKQHESGALIPDQALLPFPDSTSGKKEGLSFKDLSSRLKVFKQIVHGGVCFKHVGADLTNFNDFVPRNMFLTFSNKSQLALENVRPVLLDYSRCVIWSQSRQGTHGRLDEVYPDAPPIPSRYVLDKSPMQRLPRPPHPLIIYNHVSWLQDFRGWFPVDWMERGSDKFEVWVKAEFGDPTQKGNYSTRDMLTEIMHEAWRTGQESYESEKPLLIEQGRYDLIIKDCDIHPTPTEKRQAHADAKHTKHRSCIRERSEKFIGKMDGLFQVNWMQTVKIRPPPRQAPRRSQLREMRNFRK